jgi:hypothetical protein
MKLIRTLSLGLITFSFSLVQVVYASTEAAMNYKNQRGSTMMLIFHPGKQKDTGMLTGTFTTAVGQCKADVGVPLPISGYYNANAVSVTINFPHCRQVVAMTGNLIDNQNKLHTLWLDAAPVDDPQGNDWNSNIVGSDFYHRIP